MLSEYVQILSLGSNQSIVNYVQINLTIRVVCFCPFCFLLIIFYFLNLFMCRIQIGTRIKNFMC